MAGGKGGALVVVAGFAGSADFGSGLVKGSVLPALGVSGMFAFGCGTVTSVGALLEVAVASF